MEGRRAINRNSWSRISTQMASNPAIASRPRECSRIDEDHRVSDMKKPEQKTIQAIDAGKRSTWPQYTKHLFQHAIL